MLDDWTLTTSDPGLYTKSVRPTTQWFDATLPYRENRSSSRAIVPRPPNSNSLERSLSDSFCIVFGRSYLAIRTHGLGPGLCPLALTEAIAPPPIVYMRYPLVRTA
jgi:hypothetical protein